MMNRDTLTLLGCSGSLAFVLLTGHAASAGEVSSQPIAVQAPTATVAQPSPQSASFDPMSDTAGDLAIAKFGCDCPSCRNAIVQLVQTGQLSL